MKQQTTLHNSDTQYFYIVYLKRTPFYGFVRTKYDYLYKQYRSVYDKANFIARLTSNDVFVYDDNDRLLYTLHPVYSSYHQESGDVLLKFQKIEMLLNK